MYEEMSLAKARADNIDGVTTQMLNAILGINSGWVLVSVEDLGTERRILVRQVVPYVTAYKTASPGGVGRHRVNLWSVTIKVEDYDSGTHL